MKPFALSLIGLVVLNALLQLFLPWWIIVVTAFAVGFIVKQTAWMSFVSGFCAVFVLWAGFAFVLSNGNNHLLAAKVAELLAPLTGGNVWVLHALSGLVGGLVSGMAALSGRLAARLR